VFPLPLAVPPAPTVIGKAVAVIETGVAPFNGLTE
jgi:hypothetical protein